MKNLQSQGSDLSKARRKTPDVNSFTFLSPYQDNKSLRVV